LEELIRATRDKPLAESVPLQIPAGEAVPVEPELLLVPPPRLKSLAELPPQPVVNNASALRHASIHLWQRATFIMEMLVRDRARLDRTDERV
jgi:hypothetical protein